MVKSAKGTPSAPPQKEKAGSSRSVPHLFRLQNQEMRTQEQNKMAVLLSHTGKGSDDSNLLYEDERRQSKSSSSTPLMLVAMTDIVADIKKTLTTPIAEEVRSLISRLDEVVKAGDRLDHAIDCLNKISKQYVNHLIILNRRVEDLDNRGPGHNIRIRGFWESVLPEKSASAVRSLFNNLLGREPETPLDFDRIHRGLRPRSTDAMGPPGTLFVVCNNSYRKRRNWRVPDSKTRFCLMTSK